MKRNLHADLAICNAAAPDPWSRTCNDFIVDGHGAMVCEILADESVDTFITEARTGWPHALERAIAAEAEVERLREALTNIIDIEDDIYTEEIGVGQRRLPPELRKYAGSISVLFREAHNALKEAVE